MPSSWSRTSPRRTTTWANACKDQAKLDEADRLLPPGAGAEAGLRRGPQQPAARAAVPRRRHAGRAGRGPRRVRPPARRAACAPPGGRTSNRAAIPDRPLRLGFVSPDFGRHPVGYFLIRGLENLDRGQCETVCYSDRVVQGRSDRAVPGRGGRLARHRGGLSDEHLAEQIRADRIDILFDLAGHTAGNRLLVFARKPAPIQITWIGYEGTTGLAAMDYLLADRYQIPPAAEPHYRERILRMPDGYVCFDPPGDAPAGRARCRRRRRGHVTLRQLQQPGQNHAAGGARSGPRSSSGCRGRGWCLKYQRDGRRRRSPAGLLDSFAGHGVDTSPAGVLAGSSPYREYLAAYHRGRHGPGPVSLQRRHDHLRGAVDGRAGDHLPRRDVRQPPLALSHLSNVGLTETIARDLDEYVELAVALAGDLPRLAALRAGLRERMAASPLCDGKRFAANLLDVLWGVWQEWCRGGPAE